MVYTGRQLINHAGLYLSFLAILLSRLPEIKLTSIKAIRLSLILCFLTVFSFGQAVGINSTGNNGDPSSMLDITSYTKGLLVPRMSTSQIGAIVSPAKALLVYDSLLDKFMVNTGTRSSPNWQSIGSGSG